jgi:putative heme degradation protein
VIPRRSPEEVWRQLVEEAGEDEIEGAARVSVADAEKELARAGFDVAAERARAEALMDALESEEQFPGSPKKPTR